MNPECPREDGVVTAPIVLEGGCSVPDLLESPGWGVADRQEVHDQRGNEAPDTGLLALDYLDWDARHRPTRGRRFSFIVSDPAVPEAVAPGFQPEACRQEFRLTGKG